MAAAAVASTAGIGRTLSRLEQRLQAENVELMRALADEGNRIHHAHRTVDDLSQSITDMERELVEIDSHMCPICSSSVPAAEMDVHLGQCVADLKSWVMAIVSEQHIEEYEQVARLVHASIILPQIVAITIPLIRVPGCDTHGPRQHAYEAARLRQSMHAAASHSISTPAVASPVPPLPAAAAAAASTNRTSMFPATPLATGEISPNSAAAMNGDRRPQMPSSPRPVGLAAEVMGAVGLRSPRVATSPSDLSLPEFLEGIGA